MPRRGHPSEEFDVICDDFQHREEAEYFFETYESPGQNRYGLDRDLDGRPCEAVPPLDEINRVLSRLNRLWRDESRSDGTPIATTSKIGPKRTHSSSEPAAQNLIHIVWMGIAMAYRANRSPVHPDLAQFRVAVGDDVKTAVGSAHVSEMLSSFHIEVRAVSIDAFLCTSAPLLPRVLRRSHPRARPRRQAP